MKLGTGLLFFFLIVNLTEKEVEGLVRYTFEFCGLCNVLNVKKKEKKYTHTWANWFKAIIFSLLLS